MSNIKHAAVRLYLYLLFFMFFITGGLTMFVLFPLYKGAFAPRASFRQLRVFRLWSHLYRVMWRSMTDRSYNAMYPSKLTDPPKKNTDRRFVRIAKGWTGAEGDCDACKASCCVQLNCPLMGTDGRCMGYGSLFFNYFYCGRYPENQAQIDYYACPKWEVNE